MVQTTDDSFNFLDRVEKVIVKQKTLSMLKSFAKLKLFLKRFPCLIWVLHFVLNFPTIATKFQSISIIFYTSPVLLYLQWTTKCSMYSFSHKCLIQGGHFSGIYRKVQLKPLKWVKATKNGEGEEERPVEALMVLKYGGVLTHAGRKQVLTYFHKDLGLSL